MSEDSHYDKDAADHAVCFIEKFCCHTKGTWDGQPFELIDWQEQIIRDMTGWPRRRIMINSERPLLC